MICHWQEEGSDGLVISQIRPECGSLKVGNHYIKICSEKLVERPKLVDSGIQGVSPCLNMVIYASTFYLY